MPIIPNPNLNDFRYKKKTPSLSSNDKIEIVRAALIAATENSRSHQIELTPNPQNQLDKLYRYETLTALNTIAGQSEHVFAIDKSNYGKELVPINEREGRFVFPSVVTGPKEDDPVYRSAPLPENVPITLTLFPEFDNWRSAFLHRQRIKLTDLSSINKQKVREVIQDIDERFQLNSSSKTKLEWVPGSSTSDHNARELALTFLQNKGVVKKFEFYYSKMGIGSCIHIEINIEPFQLFKTELLKLPENQFDTDTPEPKPIPPVSKRDASKPFQHLKWEALTIQFLDGHNVRISGKNTKTQVTANYKEMGFEDSRDRKPNQQWNFLMLFALRGGEFSWDDSEAKNTLKKKKQLLSKTLHDYFSIKGDPFYPYKENSSYRIKINLIPETDSR